MPVNLSPSHECSQSDSKALSFSKHAQQDSYWFFPSTKLLLAEVREEYDGGSEVILQSYDEKSILYGAVN